MPGSKGWVKISRDIQSHWIWDYQKPFDVRAAWIDLILSANHQDNTFPLGSEMIFVERGSFVTSERKLASRWGWSNTKVRNFLRLLENDHMIEVVKDQKKSTLKVLNYWDWQDSESTETSLQKRHFDKSETSGAKKTQHKKSSENPVNNRDSSILQSTKTSQKKHWSSARTALEHTNKNDIKNEKKKEKPACTREGENEEEIPDSERVVEVLENGIKVMADGSMDYSDVERGPG